MSDLVPLVDELVLSEDVEEARVVDMVADSADHQLSSLPSPVRHAPIAQLASTD